MSITPPLGTQEAAIYTSGFLERRDFARMELLDTLGAAQTVAYWSGDHSYTFDGATYLPTRIGALGSLDVPSDMSIPTLTLMLHGADQDVLTRMLTWKIANRQVVCHMGIWNTSTKVLADSTLRRIFKGYLGVPKRVDEGMGGFTGVTIDCVSHSRQFGRSYDDIRSDSSQRRRNTNDRSFKFVSTAGTKTTNWDEQANRPGFQRR